MFEHSQRPAPDNAASGMAVAKQLTVLGQLTALRGLTLDLKPVSVPPRTFHEPAATTATLEAALQVRGAHLRPEHQSCQPVATLMPLAFLAEILKANSMSSAKAKAAASLVVLLLNFRLHVDQQITQSSSHMCRQ